MIKIDSVNADDDDETTAAESVKDVTEKSNDPESIKSIEQERIIINFISMEQ